MKIKEELSALDYDNLTGEDFEKYQKIAMSMPADKEFVYEQHMATGIFKFRLNQDTGEKEEYLFGIKVHSRAPINVTKIPAQHARLMNEQIYAKFDERNSRYYLLQK